MKLIEINQSNFENILSIHDGDGGNLINDSLSKLFECMNDESNKFEVGIKVAALNQLYSTAIQYITPIVEKIVCEMPEKYRSLTEKEYSMLVDKIATVDWVSQTTGKTHSRCNLSFSSKYVHFISGRKIPIYDSYIWIVMIGYLKQNGQDTYSFSTPPSYKYFYDVFIKFKELFNLNNYSNYDIDKFLWQYGKNLLNKIMKDQEPNLGKAKLVLKKELLKSLIEKN